MKRLKQFSFLAILLIAVSSCKKDDNPDQIPTDCSGVEWNYATGETKGPENWDNLCVGYADCGSGKSQSPINITGAEKSETLKPITVIYKPTIVKIKNTGHGIKFELKEGNVAMIQGEEYKLLQLHYHALSEHTIEGKSSPLEVHFVHQNINDENKFAVIGYMIVEGAENPLFTKYLDKFPTKKGEYLDNQEVSIGSLIPTITGYYNYSGSLTTPPCSEVVNWHVLKDKLTASTDQIEKFSKLLGKTNRPIQPLNGRKIYEY